MFSAESPAWSTPPLRSPAQLRSQALGRRSRPPRINSAPKGKRNPCENGGGFLLARPFGDIVSAAVHPVPRPASTGRTNTPILPTVQEFRPVRARLCCAASAAAVLPGIGLRRPARPGAECFAVAPSRASLAPLAWAVEEPDGLRTTSSRIREELQDRVMA